MTTVPKPSLVLFFQIFIMAFKISTQLHRDIEIPKFTMDSVVLKKNIGSSVFGVIDLVKYENIFKVVKKLSCNNWDFAGKKFLKEARIMYKSEHIKIS